MLTTLKYTALVLAIAVDAVFLLCVLAWAALSWLARNDPWPPNHR